MVVFSPIYRVMFYDWGQYKNTFIKGSTANFTCLCMIHHDSMAGVWCKDVFTKLALTLSIKMVCCRKRTGVC